MAILVSDIHLSINPPVARRDDDWLNAQAYQLSQLRAASIKHKVPVICAGDLFHQWKSPPELINFALEHLPDKMWAIPGQHDLPFHNYGEMDKSAFGTLVKVGKIRLLKPDSENVIYPGKDKPLLSAFAFPWGHPLVENDLPTPKDELRLAVVHAYVWQQGSSYTNASPTQRISALAKQLKGYDVAVFGDNHKGFSAQVGDCLVFNHGGFMRRNIDEIDSQPGFGLLMSDGSVLRQHLDVSKDVFLPKEEARFLEQEGFKMTAFLDELKKLGSGASDFESAVKHYLKTYEVSSGATKLIIAALHHNESA